MNDDYGWVVPIAILGLVVGMVIGVPLGIHKGKITIQQQAIECGAAQYNAITAEFEWKEKGEKDE